MCCKYNIQYWPPRASLKCNTFDGGWPRRWRSILRIGRITATVPVRTMVECHARRLPPSDLRREMPELRFEEKRPSRNGCGVPRPRYRGRSVAAAAVGDKGTGRRRGRPQSGGALRWPVHRQAPGHAAAESTVRSLSRGIRPRRWTSAAGTASATAPAKPSFPRFRTRRARGALGCRWPIRRWRRRAAPRSTKLRECRIIGPHPGAHRPCQAPGWPDRETHPRGRDGRPPREGALDIRAPHPLDLQVQGRSPGVPVCVPHRSVMRGA